APQVRSFPPRGAGGHHPASQLIRPPSTSHSVLGGESRSAMHVGHVEQHAAPINVFEGPILLPFCERQWARPAIDLAHFPSVPARIVEKTLPRVWIFARIRALDTKQLDQLFAVLLFALAAEIARRAFEIGR